MSERTAKEEAKAKANGRKQRTDILVTTLAAVITDIKPTSPAVEYALVRLTEAQTWVEAAIKTAYAAQVDGDEPEPERRQARVDVIGGYHYAAAWHERDGCHVARVAEFPSLGTHGDTAEAALAEAQSVVADTIVDLYRTGEPIPEPMTDEQYHAFLRQPRSGNAD